MKRLIAASKKLAFEEYDKYKIPIEKHIVLSRDKGVELAKKLNANEDVVEVGTYLMDCLLGKAIKDGKQKEHVSISLDKANEILKPYNIEESVKENIRHCISEHHGVNKFHSLESEICCNADCYRFLSVKGFTYTIRYIREMPFKDLVKLLDYKVAEKWNALTLDICKKELEPQYKTIQKFLKSLKS